MMINCSNCGQSVPSDSKFCNHCGSGINQVTIHCVSCSHPNILNAFFCSNCGTKLDQTQNQEKEYLGAFMRALRKRIVEDHFAQNVEEYLHHFYTSGFHKNFMLAAEQLHQETYEVASPGQHRAETLQKEIVQSRIEELVDLFVIHHCRTLNTTPLSEGILRQKDKALDQIDFPELMAIFLNYAEEKDPYYINFLEMPVDKLKNASTNFLFPAKGEKIWLIADLSTLGNCKVGYAITDTAIYWKAPFENANAVRFENLEQIEREKEWVLINGLFFNASPALNVRLLYLLRYLKRVYSQK